MGDLNMNTLDSGNVHIRNFDQLMADNGFENTITLPTFFSYQGRGSLLDHIWSNMNVKYDSYVVDNPLADHLPVMTIFDIRDSRRLLHTIHFRDYSRGNIERCMSSVKRDKAEFLRSYNNVTGLEARARARSNFL